ncbi:hypothetical protein [Luteithermobacter gelatinilyticus]|uniref:hypothetical protein n=1 Tax=Luteithermobacter gelatinilyticus TaxID=2582913 RepID=UPI0011068161|nr:hypothetical protein [Luteithermobacter gelatinilyticus]|tara:strand:- start:11488 stop:11682 length:195 start_codon:yes stop_codon:yes gene_type:complete
MVDIAEASKASSTVQVDAGRSSTQESRAAIQETVQKAAEDSAIERKEVEADTGPNVGQKIDIRA